VTREPGGRKTKELVGSFGEGSNSKAGQQEGFFHNKKVEQPSKNVGEYGVQGKGCVMSCDQSWGANGT